MRKFRSLMILCLVIISLPLFAQQSSSTQVRLNFINGERAFAKQDVFTLRTAALAIFNETKGRGLTEIQSVKLVDWLNYTGEFDAQLAVYNTVKNDLSPESLAFVEYYMQIRACMMEDFNSSLLHAKSAHRILNSIEAEGVEKIRDPEKNEDIPLSSQRENIYEWMDESIINLLDEKNLNTALIDSYFDYFFSNVESEDDSPLYDQFLDRFASYQNILQLKSDFTNQRSKDAKALRETVLNIRVFINDHLGENMPPIEKIKIAHDNSRWIILEFAHTNSGYPYQVVGFDAPDGSTDVEYFSDGEIRFNWYRCHVKVNNEWVRRDYRLELDNSYSCEKLIDSMKEYNAGISRFINSYGNVSILDY